MYHRRQGSTTRARSSKSADPGARARALLPIPLLLLALAAALIAGCGADDDETSSDAVVATTPTTTTDDGGGGESPETGDGEGGVALTEIGSFTAPVYVAQPPAGSDDLYVTEQGGTIQRLEPDGSKSTFLDISGEITSGGEQGLLSVAFAPDFAGSGLLYVDFTDSEGDTRIVEYRSTDDGATADPDSARELLRIDQPYDNHNGGQLQFDSHGLLYIGMGDGGSAGDPDRNAQNGASLLGKILRIDPAASGERPYSIPAANPYADAGSARPEIFALGLRNPWRFSFDRETGDLAIGDVGQDSFEEVDLISADDASGANFGWSAFEGTEAYNDDERAAGAVDPTLSYATDEGDNCSVTGGYVVRDPELTSLYGRYVYGDFCAGQLRSFAAEAGRPAADDRELGLDVSNLSSFGEDASGHVYAVSLEGPVYRLDPAQGG